MHSYQGNWRIKCSFSTKFSGSLRSPIKILVTKKSTNSIVQIVSPHLFKKKSVLVQNIQKVCNQLFNLQSLSLIFKIIDYNFNTIPVPKSQEKELSCRQSFSSKFVQNITILHIFNQNFSGGVPPDPPFHIVHKHKPAVTVKQSQKLTTTRCIAHHFSLLSPSFFSILLLNVETVTDIKNLHISGMQTSLQTLGDCWWPRVSSRAHVARFYVRLQLSRSVLRASKFSVLKFIEIVIFGVYSPSLLLSVCFSTFVISLFNFLATLFGYGSLIMVQYSKCAYGPYY